MPRERRAWPRRAVLAGKPTRGTAARPDGEQLGEVAQPLSYRGRVDWVALYSRELRGRGRDRGLHPRPAAGRPAASRCCSRWSAATWWPQALARRVRRLESGGRGGGRRALHRAAAGRLRRRARPAHAHVQRDAGAAAPGRRGAQGVRRHGLARAAHADLLARRLRRAAARRGARRGDPARVPRHDGRAGGAAAEAGRGPARPVAPRRRLGASCSPSRWTWRSSPRAVAGEFQPARGATTGPSSSCGLPDDARDGALRPGTGGPDHAYPAGQCPPPHSGGHPRDRDRRATQRSRRAHGRRRRARPRRRSARSSSASTPATPRAAPASGWRSRASWPSAWTARSRSGPRPGGAAFTLELPAGTATGVILRDRGRAVAAAAAGALAALALGVTACRRRRRSGGEHRPPRQAQEVRDHAGRGRRGHRRARAASTPRAIYTRLSPGVVTILSIFDGRRPRCSARTAARAARARASCSTARATSPPTPTWSPTATRPTRKRAKEVYVEFSDGNRVEAEDRGRRTPTPTSRC